MPDDRLQRLKSLMPDLTNTSSVKNSGLKLKSKNRVKTISVISLILAFLFFSLNLGLGLKIHQSAITNSTFDTVLKLQKILVGLKNYNSADQFILELDNTVSSLNKQLEPIDQRLWPLFSVSQNTNEAKELSKKWYELSQYLIRFSLKNEGIVSDLPHNFTYYLEIFFDNLPSLLNETNSYISTLQRYAGLASFFGISEASKLKSQLDLVQDLLSMLEQIRLNRSAVLEFLGASGIHKILIFNQNTGESRPTGGFIGSYLPLNINQGHFDIGQSQSIYFVDNQKKDLLNAFPAAWYYDYQYGAFEEHGIRNLNFFPCFQTTAKMIEREFSNSPNGQSADTVIFLTPNVIKAIFSDETELKLDAANFESLSDAKNNSNQKNIIINKQNFYDQIERLTALEYENPNNPKAALSPILISIIANLDKILNKQNPLELFTKILNSGSNRDIQIWSKTDSLNKLWQNFNFSGNQTCQNQFKNDANCWLLSFSNSCENKNLKKILVFMQGNISSDKRDIFANHNFTIEGNRNGTGIQFTVNYKRTYENLQKLQRPFNGQNGLTFIAFQLPPGARNAAINSPQSLQLPFKRQFYDLEIQSAVKKDIYTPPEIQQVLDSSQDLNSTSFTYKQPDGSTVIGTYINEESLSEVTLKFDIDYNAFAFYTSPGALNNQTGSGKNTDLIDLNDTNKEPKKLLNTSGQGIIVMNNLN